MTTTSTTTQDIFGRVNQLDPATVQRLVDRMETRRLDPTFSAWRESYLDQLDLAGAATVLEVGCGSGAVARAIAARSEFTGRILATDYSDALVEAGRALAASEGLADRIEFAVHDSQDLRLPDSTVDVVVAHTLVSHLPDPLRGLAELARVVRPGGQVAIFDGDYASIGFGARNPRAAAVIEAALIATVAANPTVLRTLPRLAAAVGLKLIGATPHLLAEVGTGAFFRNFAETYGPMAVASGLVPEEQMSAWLDEQRRASLTGGFFAACNYYTYLFRRP